MTRANVVSISVFIFTLAIVTISLISLLFPALILSWTTDSETYVNSWEHGALALPFFIANVLTFYFMFSYRKKFLPRKIQNLVKSFHNFEISRRVAAIVIIVLLAIYVAFTVNDLNINERTEWGDFGVLDRALRDSGPAHLKTIYVNNFLLKSSISVFENIKIIPYVASISLLLVTYFFTLEISKKRFGGVIAMAILLQSSTFLRYDTIATYNNFWTLFYVLSLYLIYKKWYLSSLAFFLSIFSKPLSALYLPITIFVTLNSKISRRKKAYTLLSYAIPIIGIILIILAFNFTGQNIDALGVITETFISFNNTNFWNGFSIWAFQLRIDPLILLFILPLVVALFLASINGIRETNSILLLIAGILISGPLLVGFTYFNLQPYRFMPLIVFFAVGVGLLFSNRITQEDEKQ